MTHSHRTRDLELLASFAPSVQSIARAIVRDGDVAEDVVQDALVVAMEGGTGGARELRRWFAGVVRNVARRRVRTDVARERREGAVASGDSAPAAADVVVRTETHRRVVAAVLALPEPYRETLLLRYFDELEPREIAERQGVPGGTVRSRLTRGIELLRTALDAEAGGDRRAWALGLLPLFTRTGCRAGPGAVRAPRRRAARASATGVAATSGALLMAVKSNAVAVTAVVLALLSLIGGAALVLSDRPERAPSIHIVAEQVESIERAHVRTLEALGEETTEAGIDLAAVADSEALGVRGLVLRPDRSPAAGATVRCITASGVVIDARCGDDGTYGLRSHGLGAIGDQLTIVAWDGLGNAATGVVPRLRGAQPADVPTLLLAPAYGVSVHVVDENGAAVPGARVVCREHDRTPLGVAESDEEGWARFEYLPDCDVVVRAFREGAGRGIVADVVASRPPRDVVVRLSRRDVDVRVVDRDGGPVAGVRLFAKHQLAGSQGVFGHYDPLLITAPTGADGRTLVRDIAVDDTIGLGALAPAAPLPATGDVAALTGSGVHVPAGVTEAELVLQDAIRLRWSVAAGTDAPPTGTPLRLAPARMAQSEFTHLCATARMGDGEVIADVDRFPPGSFKALAVAPDGSWCVIDEQRQDNPVSFESARTVRLRVVESDGTPAAELRAYAWCDEFGQDVATDDEGVCELRRLPSRAIELHVWNGLLDDDMHRPESISGAVRIEPDDTEVTLTLPAEYELVVHLLVDGQPGIPAGLRAIHTGWGRGYAAVEDPETGTVRLRVRREMRNPLVVVARADGYLDARANARLTEGGEIEPVTLDLRSGATFRGRVISPTQRWMNLELQRWEPERRGWREVSTSRIARGVRLMAVRPRGDGSVSVAGLPAGRYRLAVDAGATASEPVDIESGVLSPECVLQLVESVEVTGKIELPPGMSFDSDVTLMATANDVLRGARLGQSADGVSLRPDGTFTVTVPDGVSTMLWGRHPKLAADSELGRITVSGEMHDVVLRLVSGNIAVLRIASEADADKLPSSVPVWVFLGDGGGEVVDLKMAERADRELRVTGLPLGRLSLWTDPGERYAPVFLRNVELSQSDADPIDIAFTTGASVVVTVADPAVRARAADAGGLVRATWVSPGARRFTRVGVLRKDEPTALTGLIPGTYRVELVVGGVLTAETTAVIEHATQELTISLDPR